MNYLSFGYNFNRSVNHLPNSVKTIEFNFYTNVKAIKLISKFNRSVDNLPTRLEKLCLGDSFNKSIDKLPNSLKYLNLGSQFNYKINKLPKSLIYLTIPNKNLINKNDFNPILKVKFEQLIYYGYNKYR